MRLSFIGNSFGLSAEQFISLRNILKKYQPRRLYIGTSTKCDFEAKSLASQIDKDIDIYINASDRISDGQYIVIALGHNKINRNGQLLIKITELLKKNKRLILIYPNGSIEKPNQYGRKYIH